MRRLLSVETTKVGSLTPETEVFASKTHLISRAPFSLQISRRKCPPTFSWSQSIHDTLRYNHNTPSDHCIGTNLFYHTINSTMTTSHDKKSIITYIPNQTSQKSRRTLHYNYDTQDLHWSRCYTYLQHFNQVSSYVMTSIHDKNWIKITLSNFTWLLIRFIYKALKIRVYNKLKRVPIKRLMTLKVALQLTVGCKTQFLVRPRSRYAHAHVWVCVHDARTHG